MITTDYTDCRGRINGGAGVSLEGFNLCHHRSSDGSLPRVIVILWEKMYKNRLKKYFEE